MSIRINEAYPRIDEALDLGRPVYLTDGTVTAQVTKIFGDADDPAERWLTLAVGAHHAVKSFEINSHGYLEGITLRDTRDSLMIGPDWYLEKWPCDCAGCKLLRGKYCSVANCKNLS